MQQVQILVITTSIKNTICLFKALFTLASTNEEDIYFIEIYFDTSTFDKVEKDKKMTMEAQLGLIGGTMGLLTGFSILSGVEIVYYAIKFFLSLRIARTGLATKEKFKNHTT